MLESYTDDLLLHELEQAQGAEDSDFWSFRKTAQRRGAHALVHYPAMMVPDLQGTILRAIHAASPNSQTVLDPFVGSGTVLVEAMQLGFDFCGVDINPLAGLACLAKAGPYFVAAFHDKAASLEAAIAADRKVHIARNFPGRDKWFDVDVAFELEKINYHIRREPSQWARRLFWLALCRVVRAKCNSRISTYKLHIKKPVENPANEISVAQSFSDAISLFASSLEAQREKFLESQVLSRGRYIRDVDIHIASNKEWGRERQNPGFDIVMTSPPYGDNATTIPYGQFAYLPLHWIDLDDVDDNLDLSLLKNTHATDSASLGGSIKRASEKFDELSDLLPAARRFAAAINKSKSGKARFAAFFHDLMLSVNAISARTAPNGYHAWTTGNRRISGLLAPMDEMLAEMLELNGIDVVGRIRRNIHYKKMAKRNDSTETMTSEVIVLGKKRA